LSLVTGARLGPFEVVGSLGVGGMGEVYRARDTRLHRDVAIKILPASFTADPDRRARFEREAQVVAALNHPNILAVYETDDIDGVPYIVTELLEGETVRERVERGPLPVRKAIDIAVQIARGLAAAHEKGVVHRDLKPENVFLLADGQVKILDFGLARPMPAGSGATATVALTDAGTPMGTVGYMSPEQVRGRPVDARTDLFALGAVLFEMLTGRRAFQRDTAADTISAILNQDPPDLTSARAEISPALDRVVRHCMEKNPAERFQTARDVAFALAAFSGTDIGAASGVARSAVPGRWRRVVAPVLLGLAVLAAGVFAGRALQPAPPSFAFEAKTWDPQWITNGRFMPDGQTIVFSAAATGNVPRLFVVRAATLISEPIGEPGTHLLSISSKGELAVLTGARLMFQRIFRGTLARMTLDGGPQPRRQDVTEADWSPDGSTLAITRAEKGRFRLEYPIGTLLYQTGGYVSDIRVSPDGTRVAFFDHPLFGDDRGGVKVVDKSAAVKSLADGYEGLEGLAWSADGRTVFFSGAGRGDDSYRPRSVNVTGTPVVRDMFASTDGALIQDVARDGRTLVSGENERRSIRALVPGETAERELPWLDVPGGGWLSKDASSLLFTDHSERAGPNYGVMLRAIDSGKVVRLGEGIAGPLSPDGLWTAALVPSTGDVHLYPTGIGESTKLARGPLEHYNTLSNYALGYAQWFPDSRNVLVCGNEAGRPPRCYKQEAPSGTPRAVTPEGVTAGLLAEDGRTLLVKTTDGRYQMFAIGDSTVLPVKGLTADDYPMAWTPDRRAVVVYSLDVPARIQRVDVATGARALLRDLAPPDRVGVTSIMPSQWTDGGGHVYTYIRKLSRLFVVASGER